MKKRLSFLLLITTLHLLFTLAAAGHICLSEGGGGFAAPLAKLLLCPLFFPLRGVMPMALTVPVLAANSLLWGVMAERLVFGRKKVTRLRRASKTQ